MKHTAPSTRLFWTILILGLPILAGIGRLSPDLSALVETVNKPLQLVSAGEKSLIKRDSLLMKPFCMDPILSAERPTDSELCPIDSTSKPDSTY